MDKIQVGVTTGKEAADIINGIPFDSAGKVFFGQEHLSCFHNQILNNPGNPLKIVFSGDSTTYGDAIVGDYLLNDIMDRLLKDSNMDYVTCQNTGLSGGSTVTWDSSRAVQVDLAAAPDLLILRWGLNDADSAGDPIDTTSFETALRSGLTKIRALKDNTELSILLMTPNNVDCAQIPAKNPEWGKAINKVVRDAAKDFNCAFIDTYTLWNDATNADDYMDAYNVHPLAVFNTWIVSSIFDFIFPKAIVEVGKTIQWLPLTLEGTWVNFGDVYCDAEYWKDRDNIVHLRGVIKNGGTGTLGAVASLPVGYRPASNDHQFFSCASVQGYAALYITSDGTLRQETLPSDGWLSLNGISFHAVQ